MAIKNSFRDVTLQTPDQVKKFKRVGPACLCVQQGKKQESCFEPGFSEALSLVIFFLVNVFSQVGLPSASGIHPGMLLSQRAQLLEKMSSLHDLKKLRALLYIDLQYSEHLEVTSLLMSFVFLQYYQTSNESKILKGYSELSEYKDMKQFHKQASNCVVAALNFLQVAPDSSRQVWTDLSTAQLYKVAVEQLLQTQMVRVRGKEHVKLFEHPLAAPNLSTFLTPFVVLPS